MSEDVGRQRSECRSGFQPELGRELHSGAVVDLERLRLPVGAVEGEHQLRGDSRAGAKNTTSASWPETSESGAIAASGVGITYVLNQNGTPQTIKVLAVGSAAT